MAQDASKNHERSAGQQNYNEWYARICAFTMPQPPTTLGYMRLSGSGVLGLPIEPPSHGLLNHLTRLSHASLYARAAGKAKAGRGSDAAPTTREYARQGKARETSHHQTLPPTYLIAFVGRCIYHVAPHRGTKG